MLKHRVSPAESGSNPPQCATPEAVERVRRVKFAPSMFSDDLRKTPIDGDVIPEDPSRRSVPNVHAPPATGPPSTSNNRRSFAAAATGIRRASMFARNYHPTLNNDKPLVTCIPAIVRFRRAARIVRMLCMVCLACKKSLTFSVSQNSWVALKEALLRESDVSKDTDKDKQKGLTTDDPELTFDLSKFRRASKDHDEMPIKIKELLRKKPHTRTQEENSNIMRSMQKVELFARYPLSVQRRLCSKAWLESFEANRVVLREGHQPSCFYFVISGRLVANEEEENGHTVTTLLKRGDKFGEDELATGDKRRATVMSQDDVELFVVHADEYKDICLAKEDNDIENLEICKKNPVFNHWPITKLIENPGAWTMQNYKPGSLIVEDSSRCEWVYVIKSGQCKVVKCLKPKEPEQDPARIRRILAKQARDRLVREIDANNVQSTTKAGGGVDLAPSSTFFTTPLSRPQTFDNPDPAVQAAIREASRFQNVPTSANYPFLSSLYGEKLENVAYVALEVLATGDSFGFLAVLPKEQRGSSVSLVSCGAEVIQINKKFFQRHADETVYSLINMKFPPFPKQYDILKNLKQSFEWEDYKRKTIGDALHRLYRPLVKP
uniref:uncharacterized protein LOC100180193 isoform X1 n=1 Tax=Ciona intestinalis TaxID=7719 RepID=UPI00089DAEAE|nr:uncharacterized protein LOC100180193 isoform X1 [Ciona intestinalis]|eukprot:XP_026696464.1 uncharacterized protein LOC100180193 isoform X1 [Ciona intestinalis]